MKLIFTILLLIFFALPLKAELKWLRKLSHNEGVANVLQAVDSNNVYAFTEGDWEVIKVFRSSDQGDNWIQLYEYHPWNGSELDSLNGISHCYALDTNNIYITYGSRIALEQSTDGGKTFERKTFGELSSNEYKNEDVYDFRMYNERIGLFSSNNFIVYTFDGWKTYRVHQLEEGIRAGGCLFFVDSTKVALRSNNIKFDEFVLFDMETETFSPYSEGENIEPGEEKKLIVDVFFPNDSLGFACGGQTTEDGSTRYNTIWKTTDAGKHWRIVNHNVGEIKSFGLSAIAFTADGKLGMATANWGVMLETNDFGETWEYIDAPPISLHATTHRLAFAGQYPIVSSIAGGIHRQENIGAVEEYEDEQIKIYQSFDELNIELINKPASNLQFQIVDLLGREIFKESYENQQNISIDLSQISSGFYMYRIISDGRVLRTGKIVR
jgi:type IX secretion system substrate protein